MILALKIFVTLYALLTGVAVVQQINQGPFAWYYLLYIVFELMLVFAVWPQIKLVWLIIGLVGLIITAVYTGLLTDTFQWTHIIVRSIISLVLILGAYYL